MTASETDADRAASVRKAWTTVWESHEREDGPVCDKPPVEVIYYAPHNGLQLATAGPKAGLASIVGYLDGESPDFVYLICSVRADGVTAGRSGLPKKIVKEIVHLAKADKPPSASKALVTFDPSAESIALAAPAPSVPPEAQP